MREILFRGKRTDNGEWVYGDLTHSVYKIVDTCVGKYGSEIGMHQVDPATVGQYTGLNGIYEGDIVRCVSDATEHIFVVVWDPEEFGFKATNGKTNYGSNFVYLGNCEEIKIIGNIHDNPELLDVKEWA